MSNRASPASAAVAMSLMAVFAGTHVVSLRRLTPAAIRCGA